MTPSMANWAWLAPKPRKAPPTELLVRAATDSTSTTGHGVGPGGVAGRALQHLHPDRGVRAGVADHPRLVGREAALGVASRPDLDADRVALGVDQMRLLPGDGALDRTVEQEGGEGGLGLVAEVLLAAERAAVGYQFDGDR